VGRRGSTPSLRPAPFSLNGLMSGSPPSAERPSLGCSLPGLARFTWQARMTASLRKPSHVRRPQGTDTHSQRPRSQALFDASPQPSARPKEGLRSRLLLAAFQGTPSPPPRPTAKNKQRQTNHIKLTNEPNTTSPRWFKQTPSRPLSNRLCLSLTQPIWRLLEGARLALRTHIHKTRLHST